MWSCKVVIKVFFPSYLARTGPHSRLVSVEGFANTSGGERTKDNTCVTALSGLHTKALKP